ncbi:MAG TPA: hypothetical protein VGV90_08915 [Solirubrobacteraceae bacterium]|nr:hypothetical protein [Solirubrobacteraceae bacterium]
MSRNVVEIIRRRHAMRAPTALEALAVAEPARRTPAIAKAP